MSVVTVQLDEDLAALLHSSNQSLQHTASELMVLELYRRGTISSGTVAQLLGMERIAFIQHASRLGIAFLDMTEDEWAAEQAQIDNL